MGAGVSANIQPSFNVIIHWPWSKVHASLEAYAAGSFDFALTADALTSITGLDMEEADAIVYTLRRSGARLANAITVLISLIILADPSLPNLKARLGCIFDTMDFSKSGQITSEELEILLICVAHSLSSVLQKKVPDDQSISQVVANICDDLDKKYTPTLSKSEFIAWTEEIVSSLPRAGADAVFESLFLENRRLPESSKLRLSLRPPQAGVLEILSIELSDLPNAEYVGTQNPLVELKLGDGSNWMFETEPLEISGSTCTWRDVNMSGMVSFSELQRDKYSIRVKMRNGRDKFLGKASIPGNRFAEKMNCIVEVSGALCNKDGDSETGKYSVIGRFRADDFVDSGQLDVSAIELSQLDNTSGLFQSSQGPYIELKIGEGSKWGHTTEPAADVGSSVAWEVSMSGPISQKDILQGTVKVCVSAKRDDGNTEVIGKAVASNGLALFASESKWVALNGDLFEDDGTTSAGGYVVTMRYRCDTSESKH